MALIEQDIDQEATMSLLSKKGALWTKNSFWKLTEAEDTSPSRS